MARLMFSVIGTDGLDTTANPSTWELPDADVPDLVGMLSVHPDYGFANQVDTGAVDGNGAAIMRNPTTEEMLDRAFEGFVNGHTNGLNNYREKKAIEAAKAATAKAAASRTV